MEDKSRTVRVVSDAITFHVTLIPQTVGAMGPVTGAWRASIRLEGSRNGGLGARAALAMLADQAKAFARGTIVQEDLRAPERDDLAQAP